MNDILSYSANPLPYYFRWFHRRQDSRGKWSISTHLKVIAALRQLAYGYTPDTLDEYLQSERVGRESLHNFCKCIIDLYVNAITVTQLLCLKPSPRMIIGFGMHAYFGVAGSNNDINVLNSSDLFNSMLNEEMSDVLYHINGVQYRRGYYLADGIYPPRATFVKGFSSAVDKIRSYFTRKQAGARKDVERTFGILQGRWHILQQPA
ncbi:uncharacterized protein [Rutidosis leptorrhynchoides]|uniref:uncharacterized protein n=1 Tax=Rutidosis leptorrhynchoides TaxID=125765 RepID=UPI003A99F6BD